jgi:sugar lactone lactonase YvrE
VIRIDAQGRGASFVDTAELEVHALAPAPDGALFVGTSPDGKIYKVDRNGTATTFFEPGEKYIWALAVDAKGDLYAATGEKGVIYKIAPDGKGARFYQAKATHAIALAFDRGGNLLVGTESPGRVLRVDPDGKAFILLDSPFQEIRALRFDDKGMLYVAALSGRPGGGSAPRSDPDRPATEPSSAPAASVSTEITSVAVVDMPGGSGAPASTRPDTRSPKGAIYRIAPDGLWDQLWESREGSAPADAACRRQRPAGHLVLQGFEGPALLRDGQSRKTVPSRPEPRHAGHVRIRAARCADGGHVGRDQLAGDDAGGRPHRDSHTVGQH